MTSGYAKVSGKHTYPQYAVNFGGSQLGVVIRLSAEVVDLNSMHTV
jgi:hypothetical protein